MILATIEKIVDRFCWFLVRTFPGRVREIEVEGDKYLLRFYLKHSSPRFPGLYLHHFYRGDQDRDLHNHPWTKSVSFILAGGYVEERLPEEEKGKPNYKVQTRTVGPGTLNVIRSNDFHRVDLIGRSTWTLFTSGKKVKDWGFMLRDTGEYVDHQTYEKLSNKQVLTAAEKEEARQRVEEYHAMAAASE